MYGFVFLKLDVIWFYLLANEVRGMIGSRCSLEAVFHWMMLFIVSRKQSLFSSVRMPVCLFVYLFPKCSETTYLI